MTAPADSLNDVRAALGTLINRCRSIDEKLDDIGALASRVVRLDLLIDDFETTLGALPGALRKTATDPTFGMFVAGPLNELADDMERALAARRAGRAAPPAIERG